MVMQGVEQRRSSCRVAMDGKLRAIHEHRHRHPLSESDLSINQ